MTMHAARPERDSVPLDDSWFDRPGRPFRRADVPGLAPPSRPPAEDTGRDDSVELDDPWFHGEAWR